MHPSTTALIQCLILGTKWGQCWQCKAPTLPRSNRNPGATLKFGQKIQWPQGRVGSSPAACNASRCDRTLPARLATHIANTSGTLSTPGIWPRTVRPEREISVGRWWSGLVNAHLSDVRAGILITPMNVSSSRQASGRSISGFRGNAEFGGDCVDGLLGEGLRSG